MVARDYNLKSTKPVLDGEPRYENHPVRSDPTKTHWFDDFDVRQAMYWAVFAGAFGHTYGCHDIWMMYDGTPERQCADARTPWKQSVDLPGAWQMLILRNFLLNEGLLKEGHVPCQELIVGDNPDGTGYVAACCTKNRDKAFVYVPTGRRIVLDLSKLKPAETVRQFVLFNPHTGETIKEVTVANDGNLYTITLPGQEERGNDWVVVIK